MPYRFGDFELGDDGVLMRGDKTIHLQPQPSRVLLLLVSQAGVLVTRETIQKHIWDDGTFVDFEQGLNWCIRRIREVLGDQAAAPLYVETIPRRGYRFIAVTSKTAPPAASPEISRPRAWRRWMVAAAVLLAVGVGSTGAVRDPHVTVLVLPFDDLGASRADVATEEMINTLAQVAPARLSVIDPVTAMKFKKSGECIIHIGTQLHAQYVLLGAVRRRGAAVRSTAQLFRVADNRQVWAAVRELPAGADPTVQYDALAREVAMSVGVVRD